MYKYDNGNKEDGNSIDEDEDEFSLLNNMKEYGTIIGSVIGCVFFGLVTGVVLKSYNRRKMMLAMNDTLQATLQTIARAPFAHDGTLGEGGGGAIGGNRMFDHLQHRVDVREEGNGVDNESEPALPEMPSTSTPNRMVQKVVNKIMRVKDKPLPPPPSPLVGINKRLPPTVPPKPVKPHPSVRWSSGAQGGAEACAEGGFVTVHMNN